MIVYRCDLCGELRDCAQRDIGAVEYDICSECWNALMARLKGRGRPKAKRDRVTLPPPALDPEISHEQKPEFPGMPPKIIAQRTN
jgi:hypothetical protein